MRQNIRNFSFVLNVYETKKNGNNCLYCVAKDIIFYKVCKGNCEFLLLFSLLDGYCHPRQRILEHLEWKLLGDFFKSKTIKEAL